MDETMEKSFNKFKSLVLNDAQKQREELSKEIEEKTKDKLEEKENEFLSGAYQTIQANISKIQKKNKEIILQKELEAKKELIKSREKMVENIFDEVQTKFKEYINTEDYTKWLNNLVKKAISECGDGEKTVYVNENDISKITDVNEKIEAFNMLGGVKVSNATQGIIINYSLEELLNDQKQNFLKNSGLTIEI